MRAVFFGDKPGFGIGLNILTPCLFICNFNIVYINCQLLILLIRKFIVFYSLKILSGVFNSIVEFVTVNSPFLSPSLLLKIAPP